MKTAQLVKRFWPYERRYIKIVLFDLFCAALTCICDLVLPLILRHITNTAINDLAQLSISLVIKLALLYLVLRLIDAAAQFYMASTGHIMGVYIETDMRRDAFSHLQDLSVSYYSNHKIGQIMGRITNDLFDVTEFAHHCPEEFFIAGIKIVVSFCILCTYNVPLTIMVFLCVPIMTIVSTIINQRLRAAFRRQRVQIGELNAGIERFFEIMDSEIEVYDIEGAKELEVTEGSITFDNVSFEYPDDHNAVLHHMNLQIRPGEKLAVVGPSGGGKTTLCNLIPRFYDVTDGSILIDGQNIAKVTQKSLRKHIGIVQQDVYLFSGTVAENISYGRMGASREDIIEAAKLAGAHEFIMELANGYDTYVGERGVKLSGGQKQRISIARVFLKNPSILILDEATSALDNESEILVNESLEKLSSGRTTITIAHRLTTIKNYDRIIVLSKDGIEEEGNHEELLSMHGTYYRLWNQIPERK